jgi:hypothetical protein
MPECTILTEAAGRIRTVPAESGGSLRHCFAHFAGRCQPSLVNLDGVVAEGTARPIVEIGVRFRPWLLRLRDKLSGRMCGP